MHFIKTAALLISLVVTHNNVCGNVPGGPAPQASTGVVDCKAGAYIWYRTPIVPSSRDISWIATARVDAPADSGMGSGVWTAKMQDMYSSGEVLWSQDITFNVNTTNYPFHWVKSYRGSMIVDSDGVFSSHYVESSITATC